ncbi:MAG: hypothetical protein IJO91_01110 [Oscillospiraceae bacterium]|nr:hypothetical protein [Oscillospiraceae bacterium]
MANEKTILLSGTEQEAKISGQNCDIRNDTVDIVYASRRSPVVAGEDGVMSIPAGQAVELRDTCGTLYLLGTGSVALAAHDDTELVFRCAPAGGGGGTVDAEARNAINIHSSNSSIHLTSEDVAEVASNPNILINSDFRGIINQRGQSVYSAAGYTVDGWCLAKSGTIEKIGTVTVADDGLVIESSGTRLDAYLRQYIEGFERLVGKTVTVSLEVAELAGEFKLAQYYGSENDTYTISSEGVHTHTFTVKQTTVPKNGIQLYTSSGDAKGKFKWVKLECGSHATLFAPPDVATELAKCQRYYQVRSTGDIDPVDLRPSMAEITDVMQRGDGNYAYIAEL